MRLGYLLREHAEALEADLYRVYQVDLVGMWRGEVSVRKVANLAAHLPDGSQVYVSEGSDQAWTVGEHMAALAAWQVAVGNWQRGGRKGKAPDPIPTPGESTRKAAEAERNARLKQQFLARKAARLRAAGG